MRRSPITIPGPDGTPVEVRFSISALCAYEEQHGTSLVEAIDGFQTGGLSVVTARRLMQAGLSDAMPGISEAAAGQLFDAAGSVQEAFDILGRAIEAAFPQAQEAAAGRDREEEKAQGNGRGKARPAG